MEKTDNKYVMDFETFKIMEALGALTPTDIDKIKEIIARLLFDNTIGVFMISSKKKGKAVQKDDQIQQPTGQDVQQAQAQSNVYSAIEDGDEETGDYNETVGFIDVDDLKEINGIAPEDDIAGKEIRKIRMVNPQEPPYEKDDKAANAARKQEVSNKVAETWMRDNAPRLLTKVEEYRQKMDSDAGERSPKTIESYSAFIKSMQRLAYVMSFAAQHMSEQEVNAVKNASYANSTEINTKINEILLNYLKKVSDEKEGPYHEYNKLIADRNNLASMHDGVLVNMYQELLDASYDSAKNTVAKNKAGAIKNIKDKLTDLIEGKLTLAEIMMQTGDTVNTDEIERQIITAEKINDIKKKHSKDFIRGAVEEMDDEDLIVAYAGYANIDETVAEKKVKLDAVQVKNDLIEMMMAAENYKPVKTGRSYYRSREPEGYDGKGQFFVKIPYVDKDGKVKEKSFAYENRESGTTGVSKKKHESYDPGTGIVTLPADMPIVIPKNHALPTGDSDIYKFTKDEYVKGAKLGDMYNQYMGIINDRIAKMEKEQGLSEDVKRGKAKKFNNAKMAMTHAAQMAIKMSAGETPETAQQATVEQSPEAVRGERRYMPWKEAGTKTITEAAENEAGIADSLNAITDDKVIRGTKSRFVQIIKKMRGSTGTVRAAWYKMSMYATDDTASKTFSKFNPGSTDVEDHLFYEPEEGLPKFVKATVSMHDWERTSKSSEFISNVPKSEHLSAGTIGANSMTQKSAIKVLSKMKNEEFANEYEKLFGDRDAKAVLLAIEDNDKERAELTDKMARAMSAKVDKFHVTLAVYDKSEKGIEPWVRFKVLVEPMAELVKTKGEEKSSAEYVAMRREERLTQRYRTIYDDIKDTPFEELVDLYTKTTGTSADDPDVKKLRENPEMLKDETAWAIYDDETSDLYAETFNVTKDRAKEILGSGRAKAIADLAKEDKKNKKAEDKDPETERRRAEGAVSSFRQQLADMSLEDLKKKYSYLYEEGEAVPDDADEIRARAIATWEDSVRSGATAKAQSTQPIERGIDPDDKKVLEIPKTETGAKLKSRGIKSFVTGDDIRNEFLTKDNDGNYTVPDYKFAKLYTQEFKDESGYEKGFEKTMANLKKGGRSRERMVNTLADLYDEREAKRKGSSSATKGTYKKYKEKVNMSVEGKKYVDQLDDQEIVDGLMPYEDAQEEEVLAQVKENPEKARAKLLKNLINSGEIENLIFPYVASNEEMAKDYHEMFSDKVSLADAARAIDNDREAVFNKMVAKEYEERQKRFAGERETSASSSIMNSAVEKFRQQLADMDTDEMRNAYAYLFIDDEMPADEAGLIDSIVSKVGEMVKLKASPADSDEKKYNRLKEEDNAKKTLYRYVSNIGGLSEDRLREFAKQDLRLSHDEESIDSMSKQDLVSALKDKFAEQLKKNPYATPSLLTRHLNTAAANDRAKEVRELARGKKVE